MNWTSPVLEAIADLVRQRTGLAFEQRRDGAELGVRRAMARAGIGEAARYAALLAADGRLLDDLIDELTIGETYFFREPGHFHFIQRQVVPDFKTRQGSVLRAWSAGCASGEEAYSLAILLAQQGLAEQSYLTATDISHAALAKARQAVYGPWSLRGNSASIALPYLIANGKTWRLDDGIRQRVRFAHLNLALDTYPSFANGIWGLDLILCRNVLIYFDRATVTCVARRLFQSLTPGGWLITASSDPPLWDDAPFEVMTRLEGLFYRRPDGMAIPSEKRPVEVAYLPPEERPIEVAPILQENTAEVRAAPADRLDDARQALARGDYRRAANGTLGLFDDVAAVSLHVRALANLDMGAAVVAAARGAERHPLAAELRYLHAVLLVNLGRCDEAAAELRRVLYLDRTLAVAHFTLASILAARGDGAGARRAYRNTRDLCAGRPADEAIPLADGESAARLAEVAAAELALLGDS